MFRRSLLATIAAFGAFAAAPRAGAQTVTRWVMATPYAGNFHTLNIRAFIQDVEQSTGGRLVIQLHNNASLLPMAQIKRGVQTGQVQMGEILLSAYSNEDPFFEVDGVPFPAWTWPQAEALQRVTEPYIRARFERQGLVPLYFVHCDAQGFSTREPPATVQALRGTRFRADNRVTARRAELMGATPVTLQAAEVSQAFATNVIQSMFTSAQTGVSVSAWDYTKVWTNVGGMRTCNIVFANARAFAALDPATQAAVKAAADRAAARGREMAVEAETLTQERVQRAGPEGQEMLGRYRAAVH